MKLIIGLGNPGELYRETRHNIGFLLIDQVREAWGFGDWKESPFQAMQSVGSHKGEKVFLLKPLTYMNLSGESIIKMIQYYKIDHHKDILVLSDDVDMDFGKVRFRTKGSHGGQNGLRNIIEKIGDDEFARIKIGIGRDEKYVLSDWVLSKLRKEELSQLHGEIYENVEKKLHEWL